MTKEKHLVLVLGRIHADGLEILNDQHDLRIEVIPDPGAAMPAESAS